MLILQPSRTNTLSSSSVIDLPTELIVETLQVFLLHL
jgi:hypothetical protein